MYEFYMDIFIRMSIKEPKTQVPNKQIPKKSAVLFMHINMCNHIKYYHLFDQCGRKEETCYLNISGKCCKHQ